MSNIKHEGCIFHIQNVSHSTLMLYIWSGPPGGVGNFTGAVHFFPLLFSRDCDKDYEEHKHLWRVAHHGENDISKQVNKICV